MCWFNFHRILSLKACIFQHFRSEQTICWWQKMRPCKTVKMYVQDFSWITLHDMCCSKSTTNARTQSISMNNFTVFQSSLTSCHKSGAVQSIDLSGTPWARRVMLLMQDHFWNRLNSSRKFNQRDRWCLEWRTFMLKEKNLLSAKICLKWFKMQKNEKNDKTCKKWF